jgi:hypothetical protein
MTPIESLAALVAHAEGRLPHVNTGRCPDGIEGPKSRAKGCPICDALKAADRLDALAREVVS